MRIAVISEGHFPEVSGVTIAVAQHLRFLARCGHELWLLHPRYPEALSRRNLPREEVLECGRTAFDSAPLASEREVARIPTPAGAREVEAVLQRFAPSVVVYHNLMGGALASLA